jgi:hypothetical protein
MATREIGIRIDLVNGLAFFGFEEVNRRIAAGERIVEIRPAGAVMTKSPAGEAESGAVLSGCQLQVVFEDS